MKLFVICDNVDTLTGMRLAGITGALVHDREAFIQEIDKVMADKETALLLLTESLSKEYPDVVQPLKKDQGLPLIVEIPDRHGTGRKPDFITAYVNNAIGLKL